MGVPEQISLFDCPSNELPTYGSLGGLMPGSGIANTGGAGSPSEQYEVHLLSKSHLTKIMILHCRSREKAEDLAAEIAAYSGLDVVKYNPKRGRVKR